jgi:hypothetical protein
MANYYQGKLDSEPLLPKDFIMVPPEILRLVSTRLAVALMHLNPEATLRAQPPKVVPSPEPPEEGVVSGLLKSMGLRSPTVKTSSGAVISRRLSHSIKTRYFISDKVPFETVDPKYTMYGRYISFLIQSWTTERKETLELWRLRHDEETKEEDQPLEFLFDDINVRSNPSSPVSPGGRTPTGSEAKTPTSESKYGDDGEAKHGDDGATARGEGGGSLEPLISAAVVKLAAREEKDGDAVPAAASLSPSSAASVDEETKVSSKCVPSLSPPPASLKTKDDKKKEALKRKKSEQRQRAK